MSQLQVTGEAKIRDIQGPVVANSGVITALDGAASQYVRGDGTLADFPTSTGGGSSVSYYLNSSVSQGTIGGVAYRELSKEPIIGAGTDITISANGYVASYITDANDPDVLSVPGGNFNCEFYFSVNNNTGNPTTYAELYKYDGTTFTLLGSSVGVPESLNQGTTIAPYYFAIPVATAALALTDRLAIRIYVSVDGRVVTLHTENSHLCQVVTTFSKGMVSLNNLTDQSQFITTGTSGTDFNIVSSGDTHTFNLPVASATNTGKLSNTDWSTFNNKLSTATAAATYVPYTGATASVDLGVYALSSSVLYADGLGSIAGFLYLKQNTTTSQYLADYSAIGAYSNGYVFNIATPSVSKQALLDLSLITASASRTFTLPDASGTLALTSNLSSYVPYTGATTNVDLGVYNLSANQVIAGGAGVNNAGTFTTYDGGVATQLIGSTGNLKFFPLWNPSIGARINAENSAGSAYIPLSFYASNFYFHSNVNFNSTIGNGTFTYTLPSATGTLALTSDLSAYLPLTGGTLTGALTTTDLNVFDTYANDPLIKLASTTSGNVEVQMRTATTTYNAGIGVVTSGYDFSLFTNNTPRLTIASTGAATFSSSVTVPSITNGGSFKMDYASNASSRSWRIISDSYNFGDFSIQQSTTQAGSTYADRLLISASGNVGIGTSSPSQKLTIDASNGFPFIDFKVSGTGYGDIGYNTSAGAFTIGAYSTTPMAFYTNSAERMRITSGGNVGIGTSSPANILTVQANDTFNQDSSGQIVIKGASNTAKRLGIGFDTTNNYGYVQAIEAGVSTRAFVLQPFGGSVGIGTSTIGSDFKLAVYGSNSLMAFQNANTGQGNGDGFIVGSFGNVDAYLYNYENANIIMGTNATERMRIRNDGIILIGTTAYNSALKGVLINPDGYAFYTVDNNTTSTANIYLNRLNADGKLLIFQKNTTDTGYISTNTYSLPSDLNFKKNISNLELGLNLITKLRAVSYNHKIDDADAALSTGFIAQEFEKSLTELGIKENEYYILQHKPNEDSKQSQYWLDYTKMIPILVNAIQEQQTQIEANIKIINELNERIVTLESK